MPAMPILSTARLSIWMSASAALFFLMTLTAYSGYSWGALLLFLGGLTIWLQRKQEGYSALLATWSREDRILCLSLLAVFTINAVAVLWHGDEDKYLDQGVRYLLVIPILYGLRKVPLRLTWVTAGVALGTLGAAVVAWWQVGYQQLPRADGFVTSAIPFSDIALTMGFWCLMAALWSAGHRRWFLAVLLLLAALAGTTVVLASETRGSLIAVPAMAGLVAATWLRRRHIWKALLICAVIATGLTVLLSALPARDVGGGRFAAAFTEWHEYSQQGEVANNTVGPRLEAWKAALMSIPERPILGWGHLQYDAHLNTLIKAGKVNPFVATLSNTHNNFLEIWLHQGTLGLLALLALLASSFWFFCRRLWAPNLSVRVLACCGAALPASFTAYGLTQVILGRNNGVMFFLVSLAVLWAAVKQTEAEEHHSHLMNT